MVKARLIPGHWCSVQLDPDQPPQLAIFCSYDGRRRCKVLFPKTGLKDVHANSIIEIGNMVVPHETDIWNNPIGEWVR